MRPEKPLYRLMYVSHQVSDLPPDVLTIADDSKDFNGRLGITGSLWFDGENILQFLEGDIDALNTAFRRIEKAHCHTDIDIICFEQTRERIYADWSHSYFGSQTHSRAVAEQFAGGPDICLRSLPSGRMVEMLRFLEEERQVGMARQVG